MQTHDWIDVASIVGLLTATFAGVLLANRLAQHQKIEDKVNDHETRVAKLEVALEWVEKLFKR